MKLRLAILIRSLTIWVGKSHREHSPVRRDAEPYHTGRDPHGFGRVRRPAEPFSCGKRCIPALALVILCAATSQAEETYLVQLQQQARDQHLASEPYWEVLGHYHKGLFGTVSLIDDPDFFLAPDGKRNPEAELQATLAAFFEPVDETTLTNHPVCRYPARFEWLKAQLQIDPAKLPLDPCPIVEQVFTFLQPSELTLVFPSAYMNSPASMFGHTLLVFDRPDENRLLARSVSYAARTDESIGPLFAFAGIFGLYPGYFAIEPYYDKVEQYNDINRRDIWEYRLDFTPEEVRRIFLHTWELQRTYARYFFFDENCAYMLYSLYDSARPELGMRKHKGPYVIPIDTVKRVVDRGLVVDIAYRPSKVSRVRGLASYLSPAQQKQVLALAEGRSDLDTLAQDFPDESMRKVALDMAAMLTQMKFAEGVVTKETYTKQYFSLLRTRSKLGPLEEDVFPIPTPRRPDEGHPSSLLALGAGWERSEPYTSLRLRPAYHELMDNDIGYDRGAQILFLNTIGRWYPERDKFQLQHLDIVSVESIAPRNQFFQPYSWKVRTGLSQHPRRPNQDSLVFFLNTGSGLAWENRLLPGLIFGMAEVRGQLAPQHPDSYAGGGGVSIGWMISFTEQWKVLARASATWMALGETYEDHAASLGTDLRITDRWSLRLESAYTWRDGYEYPEAQLWLHHYF